MTEYVHVKGARLVGDVSVSEQGHENGPAASGTPTDASTGPCCERRDDPDQERNPTSCVLGTVSVSEGGRTVLVHLRGHERVHDKACPST